jgi:hypothetical protein
VVELIDGQSGKTVVTVLGAGTERLVKPLVEVPVADVASVVVTVVVAVVAATTVPPVTALYTPSDSRKEDPGRKCTIRRIC